MLKSLDTFNQINSNKDISRLIGKFLDNQNILNSIAKMSYTHPNGFDKIVIPSDTTSEDTLRIHIWWPNSLVQKREVIHSHQWNFKSKVILGTLKFSLYLKSPTGEAFNKYECVGDPNNLNGVINKNGTQRLEKEMVITVSEGSEYWLGHNAIHMIHKNNAEIVLTIVCQGPFVTKKSYIFSKKPFFKPSPRSNFTTFKLQNRLQKIIDLLT
jgi:hypothetical protein